MNKAIIIGRLGQDPKVSQAQTGNIVANLSIATDESFTGQDGIKIERTEWHRVVVFGKQAEFCANYLSKGRLVLIEGKVQTRKWQDQEGHDRWSTEVVASRVQALEPKTQHSEHYHSGDDRASEPKLSTSTPRSKMDDDFWDAPF